MIHTLEKFPFVLKAGLNINTYVCEAPSAGNIWKNVVKFRTKGVKDDYSICFVQRISNTINKVKLELDRIDVRKGEEELFAYLM